MSGLIWLNDAQIGRIAPYSPKSHGRPRVDGQRVISGIIFIIRNGLPWKDASGDYDPHKILYNRFVRWSRMGVFAETFLKLAWAAESSMIDGTHIKTDHKAASQVSQRKALPRQIGRSKGGMTSKVHASCAMRSDGRCGSG